MTTERIPTGNFIISENFAARRNADAPAYDQGTISSPGKADQRSFSLWSKTYDKDGVTKTKFTGSALPHLKSATPRERIAAGAQVQAEPKVAFGDFKLNAYAIVLWEHAKAGQQTNDGKTYPDFQGYYNNGEEIVQVAARAEIDGNRTVLKGWTSPMRDRSVAQDVPADIAAELEAEQATAQLALGDTAKPKKAKAKAPELEGRS